MIVLQPLPKTPAEIALENKRKSIADTLYRLIGKERFEKMLVVQETEGPVTLSCDSRLYTRSGGRLSDKILKEVGLLKTITAYNIKANISPEDFTAGASYAKKLENVVFIDDIARALGIEIESKKGAVR